MKLAVLLVLLAACSTLPPLGEGVCGNGVIDPGEDCDGPGPSCVACRVRCVADACPVRGSVANDPLAGIPPSRDPAAYRCGADDFCHAPGGLLELVTGSHAFPVRGFGVSDVDHDRIGDVVGLSGTALITRYGATALALDRERQALIPQLSGPPAIGDLDGDATLDFVLPSRDGLVAYTSTNDVVAPYAIASKISGGSAGADLVPHTLFRIDGTHLVILFEQRSTGTLIAGIVDATKGPGQMPAIFPLCDPAYEATQFALDVYDTRAVTGVSSVVFAFVGSAPGTSTLCTMSITATGPDTFATAVIGPTGVPTTARPVLADLDVPGDGCPAVVLSSGVDLVRYAGTRAGATCAIATQSTPLEIVDRIDEAVIGRIPLVPQPAGVAPDALVTEFAIHAVTATTTTLYYASDRRISAVASGDLDADGAIDAVVTSVFEDNLDVLTRAQNPDRFRRVRVGTEDIPRQLVVGDFDGNGAADVMYVEARGESHDRMMIGYGSRAGISPAIAVAEFASVVTTCAAQLADSSDPDGRVLDIAVLELRPPEVDPVIDILHGTAERALIPFLDPRTDPNTVLTSVAMGRFTGQGAGTDLMALTLEASPSGPVGGPLWLLANAGRGAVQAPGFPSSASGYVTTSGLAYCGSVAPPGTFCLDEAIVIAWRVAPDHDLYLAIDPTSGSAIAFDPARFDVANHTSGPTVSSPAAVAPGSHAVSAFAADTDGDGVAELIVSSSNGVASCAVDPDGRVHDCRDFLFGGCTGAAIARVSPEHVGDSLIVMCSTDLVRLTHDGTEYHTDILAEMPFAPTTFAVGDVTGDAVDDILIGDGHDVLVYRQLTSTEAGR